MVRKVISIKEVIPKNEQIELKEIFQHNPTNNNFGSENVDKLIAKSFRLKKAAESLSVDLHEDLQKRITSLEECINKKAVKTQDVFAILSRHYKK